MRSAMRSRRIVPMLAGLALAQRIRQIPADDAVPTTAPATMRVTRGTRSGGGVGMPTRPR